MSDETGFVLVTGASFGIGRELARVSAEHGRNLVLVARSEDRLRALARELSQTTGVRAEVLACDLSEAGAPEELRRETEARGLEVEALVNNAGFGSHGRFHENAIETELDMLRVNVLALTHLTHLFLPPMLERGRGRILNVASTAGFQPGPLMAVYYASKAFVLSFSEAIAEELKGTGVTVTALCPGPTRTEFQSRADMEDARLVRLGMADARSVAETGYRGMESGKTVAIHGFLNRLLAFSVRLGPRALVRKIVHQINRNV